MKEKFSKFWKEWGMTLDEFLWFVLIPLLFLTFTGLTICVLVLL